jgi:imidazolonepropionase-like amidohydrolase
VIDAADDRAWAIRAARTFDGEKVVPGQPLVVVDGGRIVAVDVSGAPPAADLPVLDMGDATLLPGMIDSHVHLAFAGDNDVVRHMRLDPDEVVLQRMRDNAAQALRAGITTVRDLGDRSYLSLALRDEYRARVTSGPEILTAGPPITTTGGHCWFLGGEADGVAGIRAAVTERVERGTDVIKIMATGGTITPGSSPYELQYTPAELGSAVDLAHSMGKQVTVHAHAGIGISAAVDSGVDIVEHGFFLAPTGVEADWRTVEKLARNGIFVSTTTARRPSGEPLGPLNLEVRRNFGRMHREGVALACSSDAGVGPFKSFDSLPHGVIEFESLMGFTPAAAMAAATGVAARACGVADRKGRIAPGYDADLVVVAGNPLTGLKSLLDVRAVFRQGRSVPLEPVRRGSIGPGEQEQPA